MRRTVVTGIGLITPLGIGRDETWSALINGKSGIGPITQFDTAEFATKFAGEVQGFDILKFMEPRDAKHIERFVQFGIIAAEMALKDSGINVTDENREMIGVFVGSGMGGVTTIEKTYQSMIEKGPRRGISPYFVPQIIVNMTPGHISIRHKLRGPNLSHVSACSTGAHAIGEAARAIQHGDADAMLAGGCEATITRLGIGGFNAMRALSTRNDAPQRASRPFDLERDGFVMAEGAGVLFIEEMEHARKRGAHIYCELRGYGLSGDGHHMTSPPDDGSGAVRCMKMALRDAKIDPTKVGYINAHGTSTRQGDIAETRAVHTVFGDHARKLAISSTKSMTGHMLGAAGSTEAAFAALALTRGVLPPTINLEKPDPLCDLDYVPGTAREVQVEATISNSFGFGGTNASLLFTKV